MSGTTPPKPPELIEAAEVLAKIADAYDDNALDDEARKFWGLNDEHENKIDPAKIELYSGRGGRRLLTLADCLRAREALKAHRAGNARTERFYAGAVFALNEAAKKINEATKRYCDSEATSQPIRTAIARFSFDFARTLKRFENALVLASKGDEPPTDRDGGESIVTLGPGGDFARDLTANELLNEFGLGPNKTKQVDLTNS